MGFLVLFHVGSSGSHLSLDESPLYLLHNLDITCICNIISDKQRLCTDEAQ